MVVLPTATITSAGRHAVTIIGCVEDSINVTIRLTGKNIRVGTVDVVTIHSTHVNRSTSSTDSFHTNMLFQGVAVDRSATPEVAGASRAPVHLEDH